MFRTRALVDPRQRLANLSSFLLVECLLFRNFHFPVEQVFVTIPHIPRVEEGFNGTLSMVREQGRADT